MPAQLLIMPLGFAFVAIWMLAIGIKIMRRRAFTVSSKVWLGLFGVMFLPALVAPIFSFSRLFQRSPLLWGVQLLPLLMLPVLFLFLRRSSGRLIVFNVTEDSLYESLCEALEKNGIGYEEKRSQIFIKGSDASIKVAIQGQMNMATLSFINPRTVSQLDKVIADFRHIVRTKILAHRPFAGIAYVMLSVLLLISQLLLVPPVFRRLMQALVGH